MDYVISVLWNKKTNHYFVTHQNVIHIYAGAVCFLWKQLKKELLDFGMNDFICFLGLCLLPRFVKLINSAKA